MEVQAPRLCSLLLLRLSTPPTPATITATANCNNRPDRLAAPSFPWPYAARHQCAAVICVRDPHQGHLVAAHVAEAQPRGSRRRWLAGGGRRLHVGVRTRARAIGGTPGSIASCSGTGVVAVGGRAVAASEPLPRRVFVRGTLHPIAPDGRPVVRRHRPDQTNLPVSDHAQGEHRLSSVQSEIVACGALHHPLLTEKNAGCGSQGLTLRRSTE